MISLSHLTELDKDILTQSWNIVSRDMESLAVDIFQMIFEQAPDAKLMFAFMMRDYREDDKKSSEFTFHALRFIQVIESTMNHLEDPETLDPLFLNLGKIHARHEEHLGFRKMAAFPHILMIANCSTHYWSVFKECVLFHFRKSMKADHKLCRKSSMSLAEIDSSIILWREVLRFIITRMKTGLESNVLIRKANRKEMINGVAYDNGVHVLEDTKQGVTQVEKAHIILQHGSAENDSQARSPSFKKKSLFDRMGLSPLIGRRRSALPWK